MKNLILTTIIFTLSLSLSASDFETVKEIFDQKCINCHGAKFYETPKRRFFKKVGSFFDFKNDGRRQKVPRRMSGVRLTKEEVLAIKDWISDGAIALNEEESFSEEEIESILSSGR